jgi:hypothetical protein
VNVRSLPVELVITVLGDSLTVPDPSPAVTVTLGEPVPKVVRVPPEPDFSCVGNVNGVGPPEDGAVAPGPPDWSPYVTAHVPLIDRFTPVTWIVEPEIPTVPHVDVVAPAAEAVVEGADQAAGTAIVTSPLETATPAV